MVLRWVSTNSEKRRWCRVSASFCLPSPCSPIHLTSPGHSPPVETAPPPTLPSASLSAQTLTCRGLQVTAQFSATSHLQPRVLTFLHIELWLEHLLCSETPGQPQTSKQPARKVSSLSWARGSSWPKRDMGGPCQEPKPPSQVTPAGATGSTEVPETLGWPNGTTEARKLNHHWSPSPPREARTHVQHPRGMPTRNQYFLTEQTDVQGPGPSDTKKRTITSGTRRGISQWQHWDESDVRIIHPGFKAAVTKIFSVINYKSPENKWGENHNKEMEFIKIAKWKS